MVEWARVLDDFIVTGINWVRFSPEWGKITSDPAIHSGWRKVVIWGKSIINLFIKLQL